MEEEFLSRINDGNVVDLEEIQDPHNVGPEVETTGQVETIEREPDMVQVPVETQDVRRSCRNGQES